MLLSLLVFRNVPIQAVATGSTVFFGMYLSAGACIAVEISSDHLNLFVYLLWFFPLLAFNRLVNAPAIGRFLSKALLFAPLVIVACLGSRVFAELDAPALLLLVAYGLSYFCYGLMFNIVTRYREEYLVERERAEALRVESEVFESISDCFFSLDSGWRLIYINDAACNEFDVERETALRHTIAEVAPHFCSGTIGVDLQSASMKSFTSTFEAPNQTQDRWYEIRCFPRPDGISVYFRNITEAMSSRRRLEAAHKVLREQAELLDQAQDAILVQDMDKRIIYWNKGAERLYGWTADEAMGKALAQIFPDNLPAMDESLRSLLEFGEWGASCCSGTATVKC